MFCRNLRICNLRVNHKNVRNCDLQLFSSVPVCLNAELCQKIVYISAARGVIVLWRAGSGSRCAEICKKVVHTYIGC
jgi:hypothetical protein